MAQQSGNLDFSGLFKLDVLVSLDITTHSYYELGLKKFFCFASDKELVFIYINPQGERFEKKCDWDFLDNPIHCMCFEPSGTWVVVISEEKILFVPFLPLFIPQYTFDYKWSLSSVTVLPLEHTLKPTSVAFWLTKDSENILIIGSTVGVITFYSLESESTVGECKVPGEITDLQISLDDSLDLLTLMISVNKFQQWKLILEHRSFGYNWLPLNILSDKDKKDSFMSYIKLSKDKIALLIQGGSKDESKSTKEYDIQPTEYLPLHRKDSNDWSLSAQYVNGRHYLTSFDLNEGNLIIESLEDDKPPMTLRPRIKKDGLYIQGLWSQRLVYLLRKNQLEIHSANFSVISGDALSGPKIEFSELLSAELTGDVRKSYLMSCKEVSPTPGGWRDPTFMCDLQLPRFNLESCLIVTSSGAYILNTLTDACEWLVGLIMKGGVGAEQSASALGAPVPILLRAASDMLLSRGKIAPAQYLYSLSQSQPDGWVARLGVFGRLQELSMYKQTGNVGSLGNAATTIKLLALLLKMSTNNEQNFDMEVNFTTLSTVELTELSCFSAAIGLWDVLPVFSLHRGFPSVMLNAIKSRNELCRGAVNSLVNQRSLVPILLEENPLWLFHSITEKCNTLDVEVLKCLCLWLNPLQDQLRPVMRDLKQGITSVYTTRMLQLIKTFVHVASAVEAQDRCPEIDFKVTLFPEGRGCHFDPKRSLSCGLAHWGVANAGKAKVMMTNIPVNTALIGRVTDVACGRHHTLVLTENGVYSAGDNTYGQLGVGSRWDGAVGDAACSSGALLFVAYKWLAVLDVIAAGHYHSAAVDVHGRVYTWGWGVHGQLGLGSIDDHFSPQLVTRLEGKGALSVGCGACHTVVLMRNGDIWSFGASAFGQLGVGIREKRSVPVRVSIPDPVNVIAVGYFHNLVITTRREVWTWGASPQQVRASHARHSSPTSDPPVDLHLVPRKVDTRNVRGQILKVAAGWHHSCLTNHLGLIYTWGLNFDGQLGTGDRKPVEIPTEVKIHDNSRPNYGLSHVPDLRITENTLVACGGDFTVVITGEGRVYATGNVRLTDTNEKEKDKSNRVIMMKTTKRVIKIPASRSNNQFLFQLIDKLDDMFPYDASHRSNIEAKVNPLTCMDDFKNNSWPANIIFYLKQWIIEENFSSNFNMTAKLAYHNHLYAECLKLLLDNIQTGTLEGQFYVAHTEISGPPQIEAMDATNSSNKDELKILITNIMSERINNVCLTILNEEPYPFIAPDTYQCLPCCCDELKYLPKEIVYAGTSTDNITEENLSVKAANIIDKCISIFPVSQSLWEIYFRLSKNFYLENNLCISEFEKVLRKYMETHGRTMAAAILYSSDCTQYSQILSPKFYLNMCSQFMDTWR